MKIIHKHTLVLFISLMTVALKAQEFEFKNFNFTNEKIEIPKEFENENEVILEKNIKIEFLSQQGSALQFFLLHEKTWINSDDAIERNNRVYIPFRTDEKLITNKVRVILKNGNIIELDNKDVKEEIDEEKGLKYNYYAINGLEKGAVIEKLFILEENPELKGKIIKIQEEYPIVKSTFELIFPSHLVFKYKSYNNLTEAKLKENIFEGKNSISFEDFNIIGLPDDERYSNWNAKIKMFLFKLEGNTISGAKNLFNYKEFAGNVYENLFIELDKKNLSATADFCKNIAVSKDTELQIWEIENKIKKTIVFNGYFDGNKTFGDVFKTKQANELELIRLYIAVFKHFNIEHQLVFTSKRFTQYFDNEFETTEHLKDVLFYFPSVNKYMEHISIEYRIPLFNFNYGNNYGLFIKEKEFGGVKMGIGTLGFIEIPNGEITHDYMDITVDFTKDMENPLIQTIVKFGGYSAMNFQPMKDFTTEVQYKEMVKEISKNYTYDTDPKSIKTENDGTEFVGKKPFILNLNFEGSELTQKAGDKILFKLGETIGKQMEFYQEDKRILPIEIYYPHYYTRTIKIILPNGFVIKNLEALNMNHKVKIKDTIEASFISSYIQSENIVTVINTEKYNVINYPLEVFDAYKAVINAAADFNKITLIISK